MHIRLCPLSYKHIIIWILNATRQILVFSTEKGKKKRLHPLTGRNIGIYDIATDELFKAPCQVQCLLVIMDFRFIPETGPDWPEVVYPILRTKYKQSVTKDMSKKTANCFQKRPRGTQWTISPVQLKVWCRRKGTNSAWTLLIQPRVQAGKKGEVSVCLERGKVLTMKKQHMT